MITKLLKCAILIDEHDQCNIKKLSVKKKVLLLWKKIEQEECTYVQHFYWSYLWPTRVVETAMEFKTKLLNPFSLQLPVNEVHLYAPRSFPVVSMIFNDNFMKISSWNWKHLRTFTFLWFLRFFVIENMRPVCKNCRDKGSINKMGGH